MDMWLFKADVATGLVEDYLDPDPCTSPFSTITHLLKSGKFGDVYEHNGFFTLLILSIAIAHSHCVPFNRCIRYSTSTSFVNGITQS
jgi:hypothetical protein